MRIASIETRALRLPRDVAQATGTAGSPTVLQASALDYQWSSVYPCLYSIHFETALVRVETDTGIVGWGEAQAPLAPEVACTIVDRLLAPVLVGQEIEDLGSIEALWHRMYATMRVRGQTGGFMLDAISSIDIALHDIVGKRAGLPVCRLLSEHPRMRIPAYLSGIPRGSTDTRGFSKVKLFYDTETTEEFFAHMDSLRDVSVAVDALWRHTPNSALDFGKELDSRDALWLEAPMPPEDPIRHGELAWLIKTPIALGESYRTRYEIAPFLRENALNIFQPDIGRSGITEALCMATLATRQGLDVVPHISIAFGPQLAAALHFAAVAPRCKLAEYNPQVLSVANRYLTEPIVMDGDSYIVPDRPGLGIDLRLP